MGAAGHRLPIRLRQIKAGDTSNVSTSRTWMALNSRRKSIKHVALRSFQAFGLGEVATATEGEIGVLSFAFASVPCFVIPKAPFSHAVKLFLLG